MKKELLFFPVLLGSYFGQMLFVYFIVKIYLRVFKKKKITLLKDILKDFISELF